MCLDGGGVKIFHTRSFEIINISRKFIIILSIFDHFCEFVSKINTFIFDDLNEASVVQLLSYTIIQTKSILNYYKKYHQLHHFSPSVHHPNSSMVSAKLPKPGNHCLCPSSTKVLQPLFFTHHSVAQYNTNMDQ